MANIIITSDVSRVTINYNDYFSTKIDVKSETIENSFVAKVQNNNDHVLLLLKDGVKILLSNIEVGDTIKKVDTVDGIPVTTIDALFLLLKDATAQTSGDFLLEVAKGNVPGHSLINKFGAADAVPTTLTVIATAKTYQTPTALTSLEILSDDNVNDVPAGTGARSVKVIGIGVDYKEVTETVQLNGSTPVPLVNQYYRNYRLQVMDSGTYSSATQSSHNSTITLRVVSAGAIWSQISKDGTFGLGQSEIGAFTIPAGKTGYIMSKNISIESAKNASVFMFVRDQIDVVSAPFGAMRALELDRNVGERIDIVPKSVLAVVQEKTDVGFMARSITGTTAISVDFEILLIDNN